jgi:hypothetical protein
MNAQMLKICRCSILGILLALNLPLAARADTPPSEVLAAAQSGLPVFLQSISRADITQFGFKSSQELAAATLGEPYQVFILTPNAIKAYQPGMRLSSLLTMLNRWEFPVMVGGEPRTILTVELMRGKWEAVGIGGLDLPKNLQSARMKLPALAATKTTGSYTTKLVQVLQVNASFIAVESSEGDYLVPTLGRQQSLGLENLKVYTLDEVMPALDTSVQKSIQLSNDLTNATFGGGGGGAAAEQSSKESNLGLLVILLLGVTAAAAAIGLKVVRRNH